MAHPRAYSIQTAVFDAFIRPTIGHPRHHLLQPRTFTCTSIAPQKLTRKQREQAQANGLPTAADQERIRKAAERAAHRSAKAAQKPREGRSAQQILDRVKTALANGQVGGRRNTQVDPLAAEKAEAKLAKEEEKRAPENEEIFAKGDIIHLIDRENRYHKRVYLEDVLADLDRSVEKLLLVKGNKGADDDGRPVCRIFTLQHLNDKKRRTEGRSAEVAKGEKSAKELEITWTIGPADLELKTRQMVRFLEEGRKLDITIARKIRRKAPEKTVEEMNSLIEHVRRTVKGVKGAREYKTPEGELANTMDLYFEGPKGGIDTKGKAEVEDSGAEDLIEPEIAGIAAS